MINILGLFHLYGLLIGLGVMAGVLIVERMSRWFDIDPKWLEDSMLWIILGAVVGARVYHLVTDWQLYQYSSEEIDFVTATWNFQTTLRKTQDRLLGVKKDWKIWSRLAMERT